MQPHFVPAAQGTHLLQRKGFPSSVALHLLRCCCSTGLLAPLAYPHCQTAYRLSRALWVFHCSILTELAKLHQPDRALATFAWFEQSPQYSVDGCLLYTRMISILGRHKRHTAHALRIFDRMQARRIQPDLMCFNAAINVAGAAQCCCCEDVGALVYTPR